VQTGDDIYVATDQGKKLHFKVTHTAVHPLSSMVPDELFNRGGGKYLHLITCAGQLTEDGSTYTHRLVVYATLVE
jgi:sortase (surface protein transpeptidase)